MTDGFERVVEGSLWMAVDYGVTAVLGAVFWALMARMVPAVEVGRATTAIALATTLVAFVSLGVPAAASKFIAEYRVRGQVEYTHAVYRLSVKLVFGAGLAAAAALLLLSPSLSSWVYRDSSLATLLFAVAFALPFQGLLVVLNASYQGCQRMDLCALGDSGNSVVRLLGAAIFVYLGLGAVGVVLGSAIGVVFAALLGFAVLAAKALPRLGRGDADPPGGLLRQVVGFSVPNYVGGASGVVTTQATLLLLGLVGMAAVAYYNIANLIVALLNGVLGAVGIALLPTVSGGWAEGKSREMAVLLEKSTRISLVLGGPLILVALIFPGEILTLVSPEYSAAGTALQVLALSVVPALMARCALAFLNGVGRPRAVMKVSVLSALVSLSLSAVLIPVYGPFGAAWAILASALVAALLGFASARMADEAGLSMGALLKPLVCLLLAAVGAFSVGIVTGSLLGASVAAGLVYLTAAVALKAASRDEVDSVVRLGLRLVSSRRPSS